jgi:hypothetical protein
MKQTLWPQVEYTTVSGIGWNDMLMWRAFQTSPLFGVSAVSSSFLWLMVIAAAMMMMMMW